MSRPTLYHFDQFGAFTGATSLARRSPEDVDEVWIVPDRSTLIEPPAVGAGQIAVFSDDRWSVTTNLRGQFVFSKATQARRVVDEPGDIDAATETLIPPPSPKHVWGTNNWRLPLSEVKAARRAEVDVELDQRNLAGFTHAARVFQIDEASLGKITQLGLLAQAAPGTWDAGFTYPDADDDEVPFTAADFMTFALAAFRAVGRRRRNARALKAAIKAATDPAGVAAVDITLGWGS